MVLGHQKPSISASVFHRNFMFFPNPLPEAIFGGSKCPSIRKSAFLDRFSIFRGSQNRPLAPQLRQQTGGALRPFIYQIDPLRPFWPQGVNLINKWPQGRFLVYFGRLFNQFRLYFQGKSTDCGCNRRQDSVTDFPIYFVPKTLED